MKKNAPYSNSLQRYTKEINTIVDGYILSSSQIIGGAKTIFHVFTQKMGKISIACNSLLIKNQYFAPLDYVEIGFLEKGAPHIMGNMHYSRIHTAASIDRITSSLDHFSSKEPLNNWPQALQRTGYILKKELEDEIARSEVWEILSALFAIEQPLKCPHAIVLLIASIFLSDEGVDLESFMNVSSVKESTLQKIIQRDIEILLQGDMETILEHEFSSATEQYICETIGVR